MGAIGSTGAIVPIHQLVKLGQLEISMLEISISRLLEIPTIQP
jgi:hypothetical protein